MGMPVIEPSTTTPEQALADILESIALEEAALAHIMNAEGQKIQAVAPENGTINVEDALAVNASVNTTLKTIFKIQALLQFKLENVTDLAELLGIDIGENNGG